MGKLKKTRFKGHETFYFREGWIEKILVEYNKQSNDALDLLNPAKGIVDLGIGKNMILSLKYWLRACNLIEQKGKKLVFTPFGEFLATFDPFLEEIDSIWLLHFFLVKNHPLATAWYIFFLVFQANEFTFEDLKRFVINYLNLENIKFKESSLDSDLHLLVNMYSSSAKNTSPDENTFSPLSRLELLSVSDRKMIFKERPNIRSLSDRIIYFAILCALEQEKIDSEDQNPDISQPTKNSISLNRLLEGEESIKTIFNLDRTDILNYVQELEDKGLLIVVRTAGLNMLYVKNYEEPISYLRKAYKVDV